MKEIIHLQKRVRDIPELRELGMEIAQFIFTTSQENLVKPMPWGDEERGSSKRASTISSDGILLQSGIPPYWDGDNIIAFRYDAPHAIWVEYGTEPHPVAAGHLIKWVEKKMQLRGQEATRVAYAIANKIKHEGMPPHPFIRPAIDAAERKYKFKIISE